MFRRLVFLVLELHGGKKDEEEAGQMSETYPNIIDFHGFLLELAQVGFPIRCRGI